MYRQRYPDDPGMHNMPTTYTTDGATRVTYRENPSFCKRVRDSLVGILVGMVLICASSALLFWNEGRAVQTAKSLDEGLRAVVPLPNIDVAFDENNHKLVHLIGQLNTAKALGDPSYNIQIHAAKLRRNVEMYQWIEHEHKSEINEGDRTRIETSYSYDTAWKSDAVNSNNFNIPTNHHNPPDFDVKPTHYQANNVNVGGFKLSAKLIADISNWKKLPAANAALDPQVKIHMDLFYHGLDPHTPKVGDLRVTHEYAGESGFDQSDSVSIIARQQGASLTAYQTQAGDPLEIMYIGTYSAAQIFGNEQTQNTMMTWGVRMGGWLLAFIAFQCLTSIITTLVDWLPIVREIVSLGVTMMNVSLSISLSLTVIAIGWIYYRPLLGISLIVCACVPFVLSWWKNRERRQEPRTYEPTTYRSVYD